MDRPIIFSAPMVRALLEGRKTQTRRIMKPQPSDYKPGELRHPPQHPLPYFDAYNGGPHWCWWSRDDRQGPDWIRCPYGQSGDKLWVRETWADVNTSVGPGIGYRADRGFYQPEYDGHDFGGGPSYDYDKYPGHYSMWFDDLLAGALDHRWRSPIHMPRWASRLTLEVTEVRVQRLQEISEEDALAEGVREPSLGGPLHAIIRGDFYEVPRDVANPLILWEFLWKEIHGDASWDANPWVWAVSFSPLPSYQSAAPEEVSRG